MRPLNVMRDEYLQKMKSVKEWLGHADKDQIGQYFLESTDGLEWLEDALKTTLDEF